MIIRETKFGPTLLKILKNLAAKLGEISTSIPKNTVERLGMTSNDLTMLSYEMCVAKAIDLKDHTEVNKAT